MVSWYTNEDRQQVIAADPSIKQINQIKNWLFENSFNVKQCIVDVSDSSYKHDLMYELIFVGELLLV
jgi:hypothetical protein